MFKWKPSLATFMFCLDWIFLVLETPSHWAFTLHYLGVSFSRRLPVPSGFSEASAGLFIFDKPEVLGQWPVFWVMSEDGSPPAPILSFLERSALPHRWVQPRDPLNTECLHSHLLGRYADCVPREHYTCWDRHGGGLCAASRSSQPTCTQRLFTPSCLWSEGSASLSRGCSKDTGLRWCCGARTVCSVQSCTQSSVSPHPVLPPQVNGCHPLACVAWLKGHCVSISLPLSPQNASHSWFEIL